MNPYEYLMTRLGFWFDYNVFKLTGAKILKFKNDDVFICDKNDLMRHAYQWVWNDMQYFRQKPADVREYHMNAVQKKLYSIFLNLPKEFSSVEEVDLFLVLNGLNL